MPYHSGGWPTTSNHGPSRILESLWVKFVKLQRLRDEILQDFGVAWKTDSISRDDAEIADEVFAPIADELNKLACQAAAVESKSQADMEYKSIILAEYLPAHDHALHVVLARSLIDDIKRCARPRPSEPAGH